MAEIITKPELPTALQSAESIDLMLAGANAKASRVAPCLSDDPTTEQIAEAKLVLVGAIRRWVEAGAGAFSQQTAGPFSVSTDTRQRTGWRLWPSEITDLQDICKTADPNAGKAFAVDTVIDGYGAHAEVCSILWGAPCSCGADIAGYPLYEVP